MQYRSHFLSVAVLIAGISACYANMPVTQERIIVFASFSMPAASLKGWMQEAQRINAPVVIRGLVNNSFKTTMQKMAELTQDNHGGVQLDPTLFQHYQIKQVPAVVVARGDNFDVIYGDVTLSYALGKVVDQQDDMSSIAGRALKQLRDNHET